MQEVIEFAGNNALLTTGLIASGLAVIFYELRLKARDIASLGVPMAVRLINDGSAVIDVRASERYLDGHIIDARNVPEEQLLKNAGDHAGKDRKVLLVCDTGARSGGCVAQLRKEGHDNVFSLRGGLEEWRKENLPLVSGK